MRALNYIGGALQRNGVSALLMLLGLAVIGWALLWPRSSPDRAVALVVGAVLVLAGVPGIEEIGSQYLGLKKRGSDAAKTPEAGQTAVEVEQLRRDQPDPEAANLTGDDSWLGAKYRLGERALDWLLRDLDGKLAGCEARVFLYDAEVKKLMPAWRPDQAEGPPMGWPPGVGVTGVAFAEKRYACAKWEKTHDGTYGLTPDMRARFMDLKAVSAVPLFNHVGEVVGTLSLSSREVHTRLLTDGGYEQLLALAEQVAVVLDELMGISS